ncbi:Ger(x)C family spore germination protein [Cytobacillus horneckiae]|uniref:Ger(x)C family spore germination protein n=1 Tax=Cytobacillus horneckiae TaxID=549687 RepID=UPI003D9A5F17
MKTPLTWIRNVIIITCAVFFLGGCWDARDIQDIHYITAMGIDYKDDHFVVYSQVVSFAGVAKTEDRQTEPTPVWVATGTGKTLSEAIINLYEKANQQIYWAHISLIVFSENTLKEGLDKVNDTLLRFQQIRETTWLYGTSDSIEKIFMVTNLFGSSVQTSLFNPMDIYELHSLVPPIRIQRFFSEYYEPGMTIKLPKLSIIKAVWKEEKSKEDTAKLTGAFLMKNQDLKGELAKDQLNGFRWMSNTTRRAPLTVNANDDNKIVLMINRPKVKIKPVYKSSIMFDVNVKIKAAVSDMEANIPLAELIDEAEKEVKKEIMETYEAALEENTDIYNLEEVVYRKNLQKWREHFEGQFALNEDSIRNIDVEVTIQQTGDFDFEHLK